MSVTGVVIHDAQAWIVYGVQDYDHSLNETLVRVFVGRDAEALAMAFAVREAAALPDKLRASVKYDVRSAPLSLSVEP